MSDSALMVSIRGKLAGSNGCLFSAVARGPAEVPEATSPGVSSGFDFSILALAAPCLRRDHRARKPVSLLIAVPWAVPCQCFRICTIALSFLECPLDMVFGDERGNSLAHRIGHRHGFNDSLG